MLQQLPLQKQVPPTRVQKQVPPTPLCIGWQLVQGCVQRYWLSGLQCWPAFVDPCVSAKEARQRPAAAHIMISHFPARHIQAAPPV